MKKLLTILLTLILASAIIGCDKEPPVNGPGGMDTSPESTIPSLGVSADVKNVTRTGLTLVLTGPGKPCDGEITTGSQFRLEKYIDGQWTRMETLVPEDELAWTMIAYLIPCNDDPQISDTVEIETRWSYIYGELGNGKYRVVKDITESRGAGNSEIHTVYAEFVIDDTTKQTPETGYPDGQVHQEMVMYNGRVFIHDDNGFDSPLPDGYELVGKVETVDNENIPDKDFAACHLDKGQCIYADISGDGTSDTIYVKFSEGYAAFTATTDPIYG